MQEVFKTIGQVAASDVTVMITGESGTGKELVARCVAQHSHRSGKPFIAVNCAAIPENLIESELFGHEKGAFTGATVQKPGKFELCDGGTIFLDEIGDMSLSTQTKVLRAIQEGEIQRVGGTQTIKVDVRLVCATNKDLEKMVKENEFREDLYYRLNVVRLRLPPLRERRGDIPQLVDFMLQRLAKSRKAKAKAVSRDVLELFGRHDWPGNVRELENVIYRAAVVAKGETILPKDLPGDLSEGVEGAGAAEVTPEAAGATGETAPATPAAAKPEPEEAEAPAAVAEAPAGDLQSALDAVYASLREESEDPILSVLEKEMVLRALEETGGNQVKTSALLGITRATLRKRIEQWGLKG
jgi:two-component system nitrogen regulation response regulator GlnG